MAEDYDRAVRDVRRRMPECLGRSVDPEDVVMGAVGRLVADELVPRPGTLFFFARQSLRNACRSASAEKRRPRPEYPRRDVEARVPGPVEHLAAVELLETIMRRARPGAERRALLQLAAGAPRSEVAAAKGWHHSRLIRLLADCRREA